MGIAVSARSSPFASRPPSSRARRFTNVGRALARVYLGYRYISLAERWRGDGWAEQRRSRHHTRSAERLYATAVKLQGMLIKAGQFLGTRADLLPAEYVEVLSRLQDQVPPQPFPIVRDRVERELGRPLGELFAEFDEAPVASASLAQVHRARLHDGRTAAVKVQYPGIEKIVEIDLRNVRFFLRVLNRLERGMDLSVVAEEMSRNIPKELDFINEGRNAERVRANFAGDASIVVPEIYWEYTTRRVLTMEYLEGVKITDLAGLDGLGVDKREVHRILMDAFLTQMLRHGFFHADPHPGNLLVQPGPKVALVDFGLAMDLPPTFRQALVRWNRAVIAEDAAALGQTYREMGFRMKGDADESYAALADASFGNVIRSTGDQGWAEREVLEESNRATMRLLRQTPLVSLPPEILLVGRVSGLLNGLGKILDARLNLVDAIARFTDDEDAATGAS